MTQAARSATIAAKFYRGVRPLHTTCSEALKVVDARCYDYT